MAHTAQIIPLAKRLPAHKGVFDYSVPEAMETLQPGEIVEIPFRKGTRLGLVSGVSEITKTSELRPILKRISRTPLLFAHELRFLFSATTLYGVSPAIVAHLMLPPLQKRKMATIPPLSITFKPSSSPLPTFITTASTDERITVIVNAAKEEKTTVVFFPEIFRLEYAVTQLPTPLKEKLVVWHSMLSTKEEFAAWQTIREAKQPLLIFATRGGVFLPLPPDTQVIVTDEGHEEYKHWDQNPRFHVKDVLRIRQEETPLPITLTGKVPSLETYLGIYEKDILYTTEISKQDRFFSSPTLPQLTIIDMQEERRAKRFTVLSDVAKEQITASVGDVFVMVNRRGFMGTVGCTSCQHIVRCHTCQNPMVLHDNEQALLCHYCKTKESVPSTCPSCHNPTIRYSNVGTAFIEQGVRSLFDDRNEKHIYRIDGDDIPSLKEHDESRIIIGTEKVLPYLRREKTSTIIFIDLDSILHVPEYQMSETIWHLLHDLAVLCPNARLFAQTNHKEHLVFSANSEPDRFYRTELSARKSLGYPPYTTLVRLLFSHEDKKVAFAGAESMQKTLEERLTNQEKSGIIQGPFEMHPHFYRHEFWYTLIIRLPKDKAPTLIPFITDNLKPGWRVDVRPNSMLRF